MKTSPDTLIKASGLCLNIGGKSILSHIDMHIQRREIITLVGPNGSGKTSLIRLLLGLLNADSGTIERQENLKIGYMPQKLHVDISLPISVKRFLQLSGVSDEKKLLSTLARVQAESVLNKPLQNISGGELQRVLLARALLRQPDLLILDEPAQGVDIGGQQQLYQLIAQIRDETSCGVLMVSHDLHLVMEATDQVMCLNTHICCTGHPEAVSQHPEYLKLFGGSLPGIGIYSHNHDHSHDIHGDVVVCHHSEKSDG